MCAYNGEREQLDSIAAQTRLPTSWWYSRSSFSTSRRRGSISAKTCTGARSLFRGGYLSPGSFTEYAKGLVDQLNAWHCRKPDCFAVEDFARSAASLHFYPAIVLIERRPMAAPCERKVGDPALGRRRRGLQAWLRARRLRGA